MKAVRLHALGSYEELVYEDAPKPAPQEGEVLVRIHATGVTPTELSWSTNWQTASGRARQLPLIPGHDLSGVIEAVGAAVNEVAAGTAVFGLTDFTRDGAEAEYAIALPSELAPMPRSLDHVQAAVVPLAALTAWQALFDCAALASGQRVLVHGAASAIGSFAVQLARWAGARVIGTTSTCNLGYVRELGADEAIDYTTRFEDVEQDLDVVLDAVGGKTLERSWRMLRRDGVLVSVADTPAPEQALARGVRAVSFIVAPNHAQLARIGELIDRGQLRPVVEQVMPLSAARQAYDLAERGYRRGKIVLQVI
jgi:NADPH:quinone reductase-like Zn-dependent oxidoreductase